MMHRVPAHTGTTALAEPMAAQEDHDILQIADVLRLLSIAWRRKWLIVLGVLCGAGIGYALYARSTPLYEASATVLVVKKGPNSFPGIDSRLASLDDDVSMHVTLIKSPLFIGKVAKTRNLGALQSFAKLKDPTGAIIRGLAVAVDNPGAVPTPSSILKFAFSGPVRSECPTVLNAVIESYQKFLDETSQNVNRDAMQLLTKKADDIRTELRKKEADYQKYRQSTPLLWHGRAGTGYYQEKLTGLETNREEMERRQEELNAQLRAIKQAQAEGRDPRELINTMQTDADRRTLEALEARLFPLLLEERRLMEDFGENHPEVQVVRDQIAFTRDFYSRSSDTRKKLLGQMGIEDMSRVEDPVALYVRSIGQELQGLEKELKTVNETFQETGEEAKRLTDYEFEERQRSSEISRTEQFYESLINQLQEANLSKDLVGYSTSVIAPAKGARQTAPRTLLLISAPTFGGFLFGCCLALLAEFTDKSFRTPDEIHRRLGLPVVGHIPMMRSADEKHDTDRDGETLDPILCSHYYPKSVEAEAYRGVRTALYFSTHGQRHKVIQITSPNVGDGKTSLVTNLAVTIAQSGKRILLIDADLRRPRVHKVFGLAADVGLASVITGEVELDDAVQECAIPGLSILPSGPLPPNPADLLTSPRFEELLEFIRERYDFVLVDTPALLAVTDPRVVAPRVDGVLMAIRVSKNGRPQAERAREILGNVEANLLGVVVNATDLSSDYGKFGYEHDKYDYAYGYYKSDGSYYSREDQFGSRRSRPQLINTKQSSK